MAIATSIAIGAAVAAGTAGASVAAAHMNSNAANRAANMQQQAGRDALDFQRNVYNQQLQMQSPFVGLGQQSAMTLGRLMGTPQGAQFAASPMQMPFGMGGASPFASPGSAGSLGAPGGTPQSILGAMGRGAPAMGNMGNGMRAPAARMTLGSLVAPGGPGLY